MPNHQHSPQRRQPTQEHEPHRTKGNNQKTGADTRKQRRRISAGLAADRHSYNSLQSAVCSHGETSNAAFGKMFRARATGCCECRYANNRHRCCWHCFRGAIRSAIAPHLRPRTRPEEISALTACADAVQMTARTLPDQLARRATIKRLSVNPADDIRITGTRDSKLISGFALAVSRR